MSRHIPWIGVLLFMGLYIYASTIYPGGSQHNEHAMGWDWIHNYWCNLFRAEAINGEANPARPWAILAMVILCSSLAVFFWWFTQKLDQGRIWNSMVAGGGILSMFFAVFMFSGLHDIMTIISSAFGLIAVIGMIRGLWKFRMKLFLRTALFVGLLLAVNNYIYYTQLGIYWLPFIQKISMAIVLLWILLLNNQLNDQDLNTKAP